MTGKRFQQIVVDYLEVDEKHQNMKNPAAEEEANKTGNPVLRTTGSLTSGIILNLPNGKISHFEDDIEYEMSEEQVVNLVKGRIVQFTLQKPSADKPLYSSNESPPQKTQTAVQSKNLQESLREMYPPKPPAQSKSFQESLRESYPPTSPVQSKSFQESLREMYPPKPPAQSKSFQESLRESYPPTSPVQSKSFQESLRESYPPTSPAQSKSFQESLRESYPPTSSVQQRQGAVGDAINNEKIKNILVNDLGYQVEKNLTTAEANQALKNAGDQRCIIRFTGQEQERDSSGRPGIVISAMVKGEPMQISVKAIIADETDPIKIRDKLAEFITKINARLGPNEALPVVDILRPIISSGQENQEQPTRICRSDAVVSKEECVLLSAMPDSFSQQVRVEESVGSSQPDLHQHSYDDEKDEDDTHSITLS